MKPNIVLLTIDALRADSLGCYGCRECETPNLDRLASTGTIFTRALANGDHTKVAFPALLTSTYASMYTGCAGPLSPQRPALAPLLKEAGYHTMAVVASPLLGSEYGYDRGFDEFHQLEPADFGAHWYRRTGAQRLLQQTVTHRLLRPLGIDTRMPPVYADAKAVTDTALGSLEARSTPFFLWLHYMDVHWPFHLEAEVQSPCELARSWRDLHITYRAGIDNLVPAEQQIERLRSLYRLAIGGVDREIGRLLQAISAEGLMEQTAVVMTSDHGEAFFEHGVFGHARHHLYDEILHVPLIVAGPGIRGGGTEDVAVEHLDVTPTLLELAGQPAAEAMLGRSLVPLLHGEALPPRAYDIAETVGTRLIWVAVAGRRHKLIWATAKPTDYQVYDLARDPGETTNLRGQCPEVEEELLAAARQHQAFVEASRREAAEVPDLDETVLRRLAALGYVE